MLDIIDIKTDLSDDIMISGDILLEEDMILSSIKNAERRITARYDDFTYNSIGAGIERYMYGKIDDNTLYAIKNDIIRVLSQSNLFNRIEYEPYIKDVGDRKVQVFIKFNTPFIPNDYSFRVLINQENQRSYN